MSCGETKRRTTSPAIFTLCFRQSFALFEASAPAAGDEREVWSVTRWATRGPCCRQRQYASWIMSLAECFVLGLWDVLVHVSFSTPRNCGIIWHFYEIICIFKGIYYGRLFTSEASFCSTASLCLKTFSVPYLY